MTNGPRIATGSVSDSRYPLYGDYLYRFERVAGLYDYSPHDPESYRRRAAELGSWEGDRAALAAHLETYNQRLGAPAEALASARRLAEPGSLVVIGGQQPGVLTGPLYTFWKAVAVLQLARATEARLGPGATVVPVFWIGAEDHDLAEVAPVHVLTPEGTLARVVYDPGEASAPEGGSPPVRTSVGYLPAGRAAESFLDRLEPLLWKTEFTPAVLASLRRAAAESANLGEWFGRLLLGLLGREGLVVANPLEPELRALESPLLRRAVLENSAVSRRLAEGQERVSGLGYAPQVEKDPASANLYLYRGTERVPLYRRDPAGPGARPVFVAGAGAAAGSGGAAAGPAAGSGGAAAGPAAAGETVLSEAELLDIATRTPERLSTNVVLRPVAQDTVFPVLAYVGGPGETSYFGLYRSLYHHFGRRLPIVYPRPNVTLIEAAVGRHLERCGLEPAEALDLHALHRAKAAHLEEADPVGIDALFDRLTASIGEAYADLGPELERVDASLRDLAAKNLARVSIEVDWLRNKTRQQHRQNCRDAVRRFEAIETALRPQGDYQERIFNLYAYLAKYGMDLAVRLTALPLVPAGGELEPGHRFVRL